MKVTFIIRNVINLLFWLSMLTMQQALAAGVTWESLTPTQQET